MLPSVDLRRSDTLPDVDLEAWERLADNALEANPFHRPEFVLAAAEGRGEPADLIVVEDGGRWICALPVRRTWASKRVTLPVLGPWLPEYAYLATPLVDRDAVTPALDALLRWVLTRRRSAALILDPLDRVGPVAAALHAGLAAHGVQALVQDEFARAALERRPEPTYLDDALSSQSRKKLRKQHRALARALGAEPEVADVSGDPAAPDAFLAMEAAGWKGEAGTALASRDGDAAFFRRLCAATRARGTLQILALRGAGKTVAMQCNLVEGGVLYAFKVGYDPAWASYSPGTALEVESLDVFHGRADVARADSCAAPDNALMNRLWADRRELQTLVVPTGGRLGRLVGPAVRGEAAGRRVAALARRRANGDS